MIGARRGARSGAGGADGADGAAACIRPGVRPRDADTFGCDNFCYNAMLTVRLCGRAGRKSP